MATAKPYELTAVEAGKLITKGELSPVEMVKSCLERIDAIEERVVAWALVDRKGALTAAKRLEKELKKGRRRGPLHGIPVGVKDIFYTAGIKTEAGSKSWKGFVPSYDSTAVARLKDAGAIILGKTQTTEFASFDPAPTHNPWNLNHTPGGSSAGSGAAVAARMCPITLGSQTGGSTLRPASYNGVVGFKGEHGRISAYGVVPLSWNLDHVGILTRSVEDAALVFQAVAGYDPRDMYSLDAPAPDPVPHLDRNKAPKLGLARGYFLENADKEMWQQTEKAAQKLARAGAEVIDVALPPDFRVAADVNRIIMRVEAAAYHQEMFAKKKNLYGPNIRSLIEDGLKTPVTLYARALEMRLEMRAKVIPLLSKLDALLTPGTIGEAPEGLGSTGDAAMQRPWSTMSIPTIGLPAGLSKKGLPMGIQLAGKPFGEAELFGVGRWCEKVLDFKLKPAI